MPVARSPVTNGPLLRRAQLAMHHPFWLRVIPRLSTTDAKVHELSQLSSALNNLLKDEQRHVDAAPYDWKVERLSWYIGEPDRIANMQGYRLTARLSDEWLTTWWTDVVRCAGHPSIHVSSGGRDDDRSMLRYDVFGLGVLEYTTRFEATDEKAWLKFLLDKSIWTSAEQLTRMADNGELPIQHAWKRLQHDLEQACIQTGISRQGELETLRGDPPYLIPSPKRLVPSRRSDDLCWAYSRPLILFRDPAWTDMEKLQEIVHQVFEAFDGSPYIEAAGLDSIKRAPACTTKEGTLDIVLVGEVSLLAVVGEDVEALSESAQNRPSLRVRSIWRQMLMHYAALTEATLGVNNFIEESVDADAAHAEQTYARLRRTSAILEVIRFRSLSQNFAADGFEAALYDAWDVVGASTSLGELLGVADRVTARLNEVVVQAADRRLNVLLAGLAVITVLSVIHDIAQYIGSPDPTRPPIGLFEWRLRLLAMALVFLGTLWAAARFGGVRFSPPKQRR
jgi:hypothetical protein